MDSVFVSLLKARDTKKAQKRKRQKSTDSKLKRRRTEFGKYAEQHQEQMENAQSGTTYGACVVLATLKRKGNVNITVLKETIKGLHQSACAVVLSPALWYHPGSHLCCIE